LRLRNSLLKQSFSGAKLNQKDVEAVRQARFAVTHKAAFEVPAV